MPQGSTLGPLLSSIFINDLPLFFSNCCVQLYADDTLCTHTSKASISQIQKALQSDFTILQTWLLANTLLLFSASWCETEPQLQIQLVGYNL